MIIFKLIFFLIISFFSIYSFAGLGQLIIKKTEKNFFESFFIGFIVSSFILTLVHFFFAINLYIILSVFVFGVYNSIKNFKVISSKNLRINLMYFIIFLAFVPIYLSQKYHEDFGYYHLPYVINFINEKIIFGMANVNLAFIHNSVWLNLIALFNFKDNFNFLTLRHFCCVYLLSMH